MSGMRHWLRSTTAKVFVAALLGVQAIPSVQACPMAMADLSMESGTADMPPPCAGVTKEACLLSYLQADRITGNDGVTIAAHPAAVLRIAPQALIAVGVRDWGFGGSLVHSGAPPPRLLFCRMLQ